MIIRKKTKGSRFANYRKRIVRIRNLAGLIAFGALVLLATFGCTSPCGGGNCLL